MEYGCLAHVVCQTAQGCSRLQSGIKRVDGQRYTCGGVRLRALRDALHLRAYAGLQVGTYAVEILRPP